MIRQKKEKEKKPEVKTDRDNGNSEASNMAELLSAISSQMKQVLSQQKDLNDRMDDIEKKKASSNEAQIKMVNYLYNTDDAHIPELTRLPIQAARPHAIGMALQTMLDDDIQSGATTLSQKIRINYFRLMRSVGGVHLGRGIGLAMEQAQEAQEKGDELDLGDGA